MGSVGNFLFGGSEQEQEGQNSSEQNSSSSNSSTNNSVQASASGSSNSNRSGSAEYNQAYGPISGAMMPALGYVTGAGSMMADLLGIPQSNFSYAQTPYAPTSVLPAVSETAAPSVPLPSLADIVDALAGSTPTLPPPAPTPAPNPNTPPPAPAPAPAPAPTPGPTVIPPMVGASNNNVGPNFIQPGGGPVVKPLATGGPVSPGQPYLVGENQPEVFVPSTPGAVVPASGGGNDNWRAQVMANIAARRGGVPLPGGGTGTVAPGTPANPAPTPVPSSAPAATQAPAATPAAAQAPNAASGLDTWSDSAGMNFILDQGQKALSGASAANGVFNSGATGKALVQYGQQLGQTYLNQYMQHLMNYGQLGLGAASAMGNTGGVNMGQSAGGGSSSSVSGGLSSGSSTGQSNSSGTSSGTTSGSGNSKNGLLPAVGSLIPS